MGKIEGKTILVIGGAGFIGSHIVDKLLLEDVKQVIIFDNFTRGTRENIENATKDKRFRIYESGGDILQTDILNSAMKESDMVIHLAALWLLQCYEFPKSAFETNIRGTFNVLEACRDNNIERLIYSSSASVYGDAVEYPMTENHPLNNRTFYGATKIAGEAMARAFYDRYGVNYAGMRYMNVYGPRQDYKGAYVAVIMKILDRIDNGLPPVVFGDGSQAYDFIYVEDVALANIAALKADTTDEFYNVGTGIQTSIKELSELILKITKSDLQIEYQPEVQSFVKNRIASTKKTEKDLRFAAKVKLEAGLEKLIEWRNNHKNKIQ